MHAAAAKWSVLALLVGVAGQACGEPASRRPRLDGAAPAQAEDARADAALATAYDAGTQPPVDATEARADAAQPEAGGRDVEATPSAGSAQPEAAGEAGVPSVDAGADADSARAPTGFILGADVTWVQADESFGARFSDGRERDLLEILRDHGFNYVRLRSFVDPRAADGYDRERGFGDLAHTIAFGQRIKARGLGFLLDLHYSDNWADPGKQCVPVAWQKYTTIEQLATAVRDYTRDVLTRLIAAGARPDMVQLGNEITPGMLLHVCDAAGLPVRDNPVQGRVSDWANLGALLRAGAGAVRAVDRGIGIVLHIDRCGDKGAFMGYALQTSVDFITQAKAQRVEFDYFAESCYQQYQGDPNSVANTKLNWEKTLGALAQRFPDLRFLAAEYGPMQRELNDVLFHLPDARGAGSFVWEPTHEGDWNRGQTLFSADWPVYTATPQLSLYDQMRKDYAGRK